MSHCHPDERDEVRRAYFQKGPFQPRNHVFLSGNMRRFNNAWFGEYGNWLEQFRPPYPNFLALPLHETVQHWVTSPSSRSSSEESLPKKPLGI